MLLIGCTDEKNHVEFSYEEAITDLQREIDKMSDGAMKNNLLWKIERILNQDTLYKDKLDTRIYDSLLYSIVWSEYKKYPNRQMNLDELNLISTADRIEAYKFSYTRAFSDEVVEISISNQANGVITLISKVYRQDRNCNPIIGGREVDGSCFEIKLNESKHLNKKEWANFKDILDQSQFWSLPLKVDKEGLDGSNWNLEGTRTIKDSLGNIEQEYKNVYTWTPDEETPIYRIGKYLLDMKEYDWGEIY